MSDEQPINADINPRYSVAFDTPTRDAPLNQSATT